MFQKTSPLRGRKRRWPLYCWRRFWTTVSKNFPFTGTETLDRVRLIPILYGYLFQKTSPLRGRKPYWWMERRQGNINEFQHYQRSNQLPDRIDLSSQAKPLNLQILSPMAMRSLLASPQGIKRAKNALERNNLTQKALANERGIASWSTVNKFF